jgi:hypothetical protein
MQRLWVALIALSACPGTPATGRAEIPLAAPAATLPLAELSGLATVADGAGATLLAVGDEARTLLRLAWADPLEPSRADRIALPLPDSPGGSQLEAVAVDGAGLVYVLDEERARVYVFAITGERAELRHRYDLSFPAGRPLAGDWAKRPNKRGEGLVVLPSGHLLVAKQSHPMALIELGPAEDTPRGVAADATPARPPRPLGDVSELVPLAVWRPDDAASAVVGSLNELARGPGGALYLVASRPRATIARVKLPLSADGGAFAIDASWPIATPGDGKAEGLTFGPGGRVAVGLDAKGDAPNLLLVAPLR